MGGVHHIIKNKSKTRYKIYGSLSFGVLVFACIVFFSGLFTIQNINLENVSPHGKSIIHQYLEDIKNNNIFLFSGAPIKRDILKRYPTIADIKITRKLPRSVNIQIVDRTKQGVWCYNPNDEQARECYYYGQDGVIFEPAPNASRGYLIKFINDTRNSPFEIGTRVLKEQDMFHIELLHSALGVMGQTPLYITIIDEHEMHAGFSGGWEAFLSRQDPIVEQVENLAIMLEYRTIKRNKPYLQYIDLQYGNKIFYKFNTTS